MRPSLEAVGTLHTGQPRPSPQTARRTEKGPRVNPETCPQPPPSDTCPERWGQRCQLLPCGPPERLSEHSFIPAFIPQAHSQTTGNPEWMQPALFLEVPELQAGRPADLASCPRGHTCSPRPEDTVFSNKNRMGVALPAGSGINRHLPPSLGLWPGLGGTPRCAPNVEPTYHETMPRDTHGMRCKGLKGPERLRGGREAQADPRRRPGGCRAVMTTSTRRGSGPVRSSRPFPAHPHQAGATTAVSGQQGLEAPRSQDLLQSLPPHPSHATSTWLHSQAPRYLAERDFWVCVSEGVSGRGWRLNWWTECSKLSPRCGGHEWNKARENALGRDTGLLQPADGDAHRGVQLADGSLWRSSASIMT